MAASNISDVNIAAISSSEALDGAIIGGRRRCMKDTDAALSLCALGRLACSETSPRGEHPNYEVATAFRHMSINLPYYNTDNVSAVITPIPRSPVQRIAPLCPTVSLDMPPQPSEETGRYDILNLLSKKPNGAKQQNSNATATAAQRKNNMKPKDPKRDTSVTFEEMKRLMRVYGPIKALRNRAVKDTGKAAKPESIRRKFYRWFPDFNERFVKTVDGWFTPKVGHRQEMQYREMMRCMDQDSLVKKRNDKRYHCGIIGNKMPIYY